MKKYKFIVNSHERSGFDKDEYERISVSVPTKTIACARCRRLKKKCSKHYPVCLTCFKMSEECVYNDELTKGAADGPPDTPPGARVNGDKDIQKLIISTLISLGNSNNNGNKGV